MSRFYRSDSAARNWRTNIAFWLAHRELWSWRSAGVRLAGKMATSYQIGRFQHLYDLEMACDCEEAMQHLKERMLKEQK